MIKEVVKLTRVCRKEREAMIDIVVKLTRVCRKERDLEKCIIDLES